MPGVDTNKTLLYRSSGRRKLHHLLTRRGQLCRALNGLQVIERYIVGCAVKALSEALAQSTYRVAVHYKVTLAVRNI